MMDFVNCNKMYFLSVSSAVIKIMGQVFRDYHVPIRDKKGVCSVCKYNEKIIGSFND